jgi:hypothetical protein
MAWSAITEAALVTHISGKELEALRAAALADGQVDPVQPSIDQVTDTVRGYIAACARNTLGDAGTLPSKLVDAACALIVSAVISRVPGYPLSDERRLAREGAIRLLERVSDCKFAIEDPDSEGGAEEISSPTPSMTSGTLNFRRDAQDGI